MSNRPSFELPKNPSIHQLIYSELRIIGDALTRQADVMESDVEAEAELDVKTDGPGYYFRGEVVEELVHSFATTLDSIITTCLNDFERARAIRKFQQSLADFKANSVEQ